MRAPRGNSQDKKATLAYLCFPGMFVGDNVKIVRPSVRRSQFHFRTISLLRIAVF